MLMKEAMDEQRITSEVKKVAGQVEGAGVPQFRRAEVATGRPARQDEWTCDAMGWSLNRKPFQEAVDLSGGPERFSAGAGCSSIGECDHPRGQHLRPRVPLT